MTRYPQLDLGAFIALCKHRSEARKVSRFAGPEFAKAEALGLSVEQADRIAGRLGRHPAEIWPAWAALNEAELRMMCAASDCEATFVRGTGRGEVFQRYCSATCRSRESMRAHRATEKGRQANRRYAAEYRAWLAQRKEAS